MNRGKICLLVDLIGILALLLLVVCAIDSIVDKGIAQAEAEFVGKTFEVVGNNFNGVRVSMAVYRAGGSFGDGYVTGTLYIYAPGERDLASSELCNDEERLGCAPDSVVLHWSNGTSQRITDLKVEAPGWYYIKVYPTSIEPATEQ